MRARLIRENLRDFLGFLLGESEDVPLDGFTLGNKYEVVAVYQVKSRCSFVLLNDAGRLAARLAYYFELERDEIPEDWRINVDNENLTIIIAPDFLADYTSMAKLLEYDREIMDKIKDYYEGE